MSDLIEGTMLCFSCFQQRKNNAANTKTEHIMSSNWGLYLIPIVNSITLFSKANKCNTFPDGYIYHIYINFFDEEWSKNKNSGTCSECKKNVNTYYQLENKKGDILNNLNFSKNQIQSMKNTRYFNYEYLGLNNK